MNDADAASLKSILCPCQKEEETFHQKEIALLKMLKDSNLEERMIVLKEQMVNIIEEVDDLDQQVEITQAEIVLIKSDQVLQFQRLVELEDDSEGS